MRQRFARILLIHVAVAAVAWLSLAGVGFVLALATPVRPDIGTACLALDLLADSPMTIARGRMER